MAVTRHSRSRGSNTAQHRQQRQYQLQRQQHQHQQQHQQQRISCNISTAAVSHENPFYWSQVLVAHPKRFFCCATDLGSL